MHLHSDAWPLSEKKYLRLIDEMYGKRAKLGIRGFAMVFILGARP